MNEQFSRAHQFMLTNARLLERRIFEARFLGAPASCVGEAIRAYRNADGGLGHALEPGGGGFWKPSRRWWHMGVWASRTSKNHRSDPHDGRRILRRI